MSNYASGHEAERIAAEYLKGEGYTIVALNWRHARAEIDIVAQKRPRFRVRGPLVFFEVKYRKTDWQGQGFDYITPRKLEQMAFAAELYSATEHYEGAYTLGAVELTGEEFTVTGCLEDLG